MKIIINIVLILLAFACKSQINIPETGFYFKSITVNGIQSGGFYANNLNVNPAISLNFSVPLDQISAKNQINLVNSYTKNVISLNYDFSNMDSTVKLTPTNSLEGFTKYFLTVSPNLNSKSKKILETPLQFELNVGMDTTDKFPRITDNELLDLVQKQTFKYFWDFGHPISGLARERNTSGDICTIGGTGFGIMAMLVASERNFVTRNQSAERVQKIVNFLKNTAETYHGVFPHWINGTTGATVPFSTYDDGADLVETSYLIQGLLTARQYFDKDNAVESEIRQNINDIWFAVDWAWHTKDDSDNLYWHWSPNYDWKMNMPIVGWNECLITYFLAAASPTHPISKKQYDKCWAVSDHFINNKSYYGIKLPLGFEYGGPLFFSQYSFLGLNPQGLQDKYADYWQQQVAHSQINFKYCVNNPKGYNEYSANCWGLTASDSNKGYDAHSPTNDLGVITPTAALSAMPYLPKESMDALRFFYYKLGDKIWKEYGFVDAFNLSNYWIANSYLAIDQGPIICMIENYRTGLLWQKFMSAKEIQNAKTKLEFK